MSGEDKDKKAAAAGEISSQGMKISFEDDSPQPSPKTPPRPQGLKIKINEEDNGPNNNNNNNTATVTGAANTSIPGTPNNESMLFTAGSPSAKGAANFSSIKFGGTSYQNISSATSGMFGNSMGVTKTMTHIPAQIIKPNEKNETAIMEAFKSEQILSRKWFLQYLREDWKSEFTKGGMQVLTGEEGVSSNKRMADYDLYIGDTLLPLMALSLESLGRMMSEKSEQGNRLKNMDAKNGNTNSSSLSTRKKKGCNYRFNPCNWIGQFLLRKKETWHTLTGKHESNSFAEWVDYEKGRREILRKKVVMAKTMNGFAKGGKILIADMNAIMEAIDQQFKLEGYLSKNPDLPSDWADVIRDPVCAPDSPNPTTSFALFWKWFSRKVLSSDWIQYQHLRSAEIRIEAEKKRMEELLEAKRKKDLEEAKKRQWKLDWMEIVKNIKKNDIWTILLSDDIGDQFRVTGNEDSYWPFMIAGPGIMHVTSSGGGTASGTIDSGNETEQEKESKTDNEGGGSEAKPGESAILGSDQGPDPTSPSATSNKSGGGGGGKSDKKGDKSGAAAAVPTKTPEKLEAEQQRIRILKLIKTFPIADEIPSKGQHIVILRKALDFLNLEEPSSIKNNKDNIMIMNQISGMGDGISLSSLAMPNMMDFETSKCIAAFSDKIDALGDFDDDNGSDVDEPDTWSKKAVEQWELWQSYLRIESSIYDGVVEKPELEKLVDLDWTQGYKISQGGTLMEDIATNRIAVKNDMAHEFEMRMQEAEDGSQKPSWADLACLFGLTMARLEWLHRQFTGLLPEGVTDNYPEEPAGLSKDRMHALMSDLLPDLTDSGFEQAFKEIDLDGGGMIEFDEFIEWLTQEELDLSPGEDDDVPKPTFEHLATRYNLSLEEIMGLYKEFKQFLPSDLAEQENYPEEVQALTKWQIRRAFFEYKPEVDDEEFEEIFGLVDFNGSGSIEFDEFLDFGFDQMIPKEGSSSGSVRNIRHCLTESDYIKMRAESGEGSDEEY